jgi:hypothetical protein
VRASGGRRGCLLGVTAALVAQCQPVKGRRNGEHQGKEGDELDLGH